MPQIYPQRSQSGYGSLASFHPGNIRGETCLASGMELYHTFRLFSKHQNTELELHKSGHQNMIHAILNITMIENFILLGFSGGRELQILHFVIFFTMYLSALVGNLLIITLVAVSSHLHTPMYFFLVNLSVLDVGSISVIIPKSMANSLMNIRLISYSQCITQTFLFIFFASSDFFLLTVMAYDRYVAICHPLHYASKMKWSSCIQMAGGAWMFGLFNAALHTGTVFSLPFCSNVIHQFFCEIPPLVEISCSDSYLNEIWALLFTGVLSLGCFVFIVMSYVQIFTAVLRMPSMANRKKAFSTCIPHITVVSILFSTSFFTYLIPTSNSPYNLDEVLAVLYTVVPPLMNPIIYSMRNKDVKTALWKLLGFDFEYFTFLRRHRHILSGLSHTSVCPATFPQQNPIFRAESEQTEMVYSVDGSLFLSIAKERVFWGKAAGHDKIAWTCASKVGDKWKTTQTCTFKAGDNKQMCG
ncbi:olfactory receptor 14A16-like [Lacerta agilis]|uniref:olfactory receptor 14A16-like n=1 Tax=Lacerta agilis TaxID=80427 RepID=UPI0014195A7A|nr:olfactory receptor 14A16-like [Lacerta agilis]